MKNVKTKFPTFWEYKAFLEEVINDPNKRLNICGNKEGDIYFAKSELRRLDEIYVEFKDKLDAEKLQN